MKTRVLRVLVAVSAVCLLIGLWVLFLAPFPDITDEQSPTTPTYISVWPPPESAIWVGYYWFPYLRVLSNQYGVWPLGRPGQGITVEIHTMSLPVDLVSEDRPSIPFEDRVHITIDGKQLSNSQRSIISCCSAMAPGHGLLTELGAHYLMWWEPRLSWGVHSARITIEMASGEIVDYEWQFKIR